MEFRINKLLILVLTGFTQVACQSTEPTENITSPVFSVPQQTANINTPSVNIDAPEIVNTHNEPQVASRLPDVITLKPIGEREETTTSPLIDKHVFKDDVDVNYSVIDKHATRSNFMSKVQAQAIVVATSLEQEYVKLRITGWYSPDKTLQQWQPYLEKAPLTKSISLERGAIVWDKLNDWYVCGIERPE